MMLLLPGNARNLIPLDLDPQHYGWLLTPRRTLTRTGLHGLRYAVDNECYSLGDRFRPDRFRRALDRIALMHGTAGCLFVVAPDIVGNATATLRRFEKWSPLLRADGWPVALAAQDGLERLAVPWSELDALFVGGSTHWKMGPHAAALLAEAKERGKWTHIGRINSTAKAAKLRVHPHSIDGTAWAKHPPEYVAGWSRWLESGAPSFVRNLC